MKHQRPKARWPDYDVDGVLIEAKSGLQAIHWVRNVFLRLAYTLSNRPEARAFLLLIDPELSETRIREEWRMAQKAFRPDLLVRLQFVIYKDGNYTGIPHEPATADIELLERVRRTEVSHGRHRLQRPDYSGEILKILLLQWFRKRGPVTSVWLSNTVGCNYRTVARTINSLGNSVIRHSDKSVELGYFPKDPWNRLLVTSNRSRATIRYSDQSGQPRSTESLLNRLIRLKRPDIAIGGVPGVRQLHTDIDLVGSPRLDLSIHCPGTYTDVDFVKLLDPALERENNPENPASLVLHFVRRKTAMYIVDPGGVTWADPVECLLDLYEARLDSQAFEFLDVLSPASEE